MITLSIPDVPESINKVANWHWSKRGEYKKTWELMVLSEIRSKGINPIKGSVELILRFGFDDNRNHDLENIYTKWIDALIGRVIEDDSIKYLTKVTKYGILNVSNKYTIIQVKRRREQCQKP